MYPERFTDEWLAWVNSSLPDGIRLVEYPRYQWQESCDNRGVPATHKYFLEMDDVRSVVPRLPLFVVMEDGRLKINGYSPDGYYHSWNKHEAELVPILRDMVREIERWRLNIERQTATT